MLLKKLSEANGSPGNENEIGKIIVSELKGKVDEIIFDKLGNIVVNKNHNTKSDKTLIVSAHMDEIGMTVIDVTEGGLIKFAYWGNDPRILVSSEVLIGAKKVVGVIGSKPMHKLSLKDREISMKTEDMYIDIGLTSKSDVLDHISIGDFVTFKSDFVKFADKYIKGKALESRIGCNVLINLLKSDTKTKITGVFTAQKNLDARGAVVVSRNIIGNFLLNLDGIVASDVPFVDDANYVTSLNEGVAITLIDKDSIYNKNHINIVTNICDKYKIKYQFVKGNVQKSNAKAYKTVNIGIPTVTASVPIRYINSPISMVNESDISSLQELVNKFALDFNEII